MADQLTRKDLVELLAVSKQETVELFAASKQETIELFATTKQEIIAATEQKTIKLLAATEERLKKEIKQDMIEILEEKFVEERSYYRSLIRGELVDIRQQLARIEQQIGGDATSALLDIDQLKKRVSDLELLVTKLQTA